MIKYNSTKFGSYSEKKLSNSTFVERTRLSPILSLSPLFFVKITMSEHVYEMKLKLPQCYSAPLLLLEQERMLERTSREASTVELDV